MVVSLCLGRWNGDCMGTDSYIIYTNRTGRISYKSDNSVFVLLRVAEEY